MQFSFNLVRIKYFNKDNNIEETIGESWFSKYCLLNFPRP